MFGEVRTGITTFDELLRQLGPQETGGELARSSCSPTRLTPVPLSTTSGRDSILPKPQQAYHPAMALFDFGVVTTR